MWDDARKAEDVQRPRKLLSGGQNIRPVDLYQRSVDDQYSYSDRMFRHPPDPGMIYGSMQEVHHGPRRILSGYTPMLPSGTFGQRSVNDLGSLPHMPRDVPLILRQILGTAHHVIKALLLPEGAGAAQKLVDDLGRV